MLSQDAIDNLIQPIVTRQETISNFVIAQIAKRVKQIGTLSKEDLKKLIILQKSGADIRMINAELARQTNLQVRQIKSLIKTVATDSYISAKPFYDYRHKSFIPFEQNEELQRITDAMANQTAGTYRNLSDTRATGFLMWDKKHPQTLKFMSIKDTYHDVIDTAIQAVQSGAVDYETAVHRAIKQLADSGLRRISWDSGYTRRMDSSVRQAIHDGVKQLQINVQREIGKQIGADGWQLSAHPNCALDHEPIQGHIFTNENFDKMQSNEDFEDTEGTKFIGLERIIGQWNCRHYAHAIIIDAHTPYYRKETLERYIRENHSYKAPDGSDSTMYEATQEMRRLETSIRHFKESQMAYSESGDDENARAMQAKVIQAEKIYAAFCKKINMTQKKDRISVPGYHRISLKIK